MNDHQRMLEMAAHLCSMRVLDPSIDGATSAYKIEDPFFFIEVRGGDRYT